MRGTTWRRVAVAASAAVLATLLLGACGDSDSTEGSAQYRDRSESELLGFGREASAEELDEAAIAVEAYLDDRAQGRYEAACARVSKQMLNRLKRLAENATSLEDTSCAAFLDAFLRLTPEDKRESTEIDPGSLRRKGGQGYLLYSAGDDEVFAVPLRREGGEWKVATLSPEEIS